VTVECQDMERHVAGLLAAAESLPELGHTFRKGLQRHVGISALNYLPFLGNVVDLSGAVAWSQECNPAEIWESFWHSLPLIEKDLPRLSDFFRQPGRLVEAHKLLSLREFHRTEAYNEFYRRHYIEWQLCMGMGSLECPIGFVDICRGPGDPPFQPDEVQRARRLLALLEQSLRTFLVFGRKTAPADTLLDALELGLPVAAALFDARGCLLWMSQEARLRLTRSTYQLAGRHVVTRALPTLQTMQRLAMEVAAHPELASVPAWLHRAHLVQPGEMIVARRIQRQAGASSLVLVAITASDQQPKDMDVSVDELKGQGLTAREAEVARLAVLGFAVANIAAELNIAESTVQTYVRRIYRKLDVSNRADLVRRVLSCNGDLLRFQ